ncbi:envelope stress sensor histidine kinase CpxA [Rodentibacter caecimuris]|uniref:histidine kinase n=1 Tax=Rodentibacter caecimuris TaxID=1796644 RepID=A0ABX3KWG8_9PAST|nr:two-component system sensor histidine kinase CpxA [Rodentibacter heylii]
MKRLYNLTIHQLTFRTFMIFWLTFIFLTLLIISLPYFDSRTYSFLKEQEVSQYQQKLISVIKSNKLNHLLSGSFTHQTDTLDDEHPILLDDENDKIYGASKDEEEYVLSFANNILDIEQPRRKIFNNTQIVGPFQVYLNNAETPILLFFTSKVNQQQEILFYILDKPHILLILMIMITTPLLWWFAHTIIRPISNLQRAANLIAVGSFEFNPKLNQEGPLELRQVGQSFNRMASSIENLLSHQQSLLSSISHELRTPLTRLQLTNSLLRRQIGDTESVKRIEKEINQMDKMIRDLLILSRQRVNSHTKRKTFAIPELWQNVIKDAQFEAEQNHLDLITEINIPYAETLMINGNIALLESAIENVIRNALKYTSKKILLSIYLKQIKQEEYLIIHVDDDGFGVPEDDLKKIFSPFYRVDEARTRTTGGSGLGLAIVSSVIKEHQGEVWAEKSYLGGLAVTIQLPLWINS